MEQKLIIADSTASSLKLAILNSSNSYYLELDEGYAHLENLIMTIDEACKRSEVSVQNIDALAIAIGPGSFTGLRIGIATFQALAHALDKPIFGFSVFDVYRYLYRDQTAVIVPLIDAKKKRFYCTFINSHYDKYYDYSLEEIINILKQFFDRKIILVGNDAKLIQMPLQEQFPSIVFEYENSYQASDLVAFGEFLLNNPERRVEVEPLYLRKSEAEIALLEKKGFNFSQP